jgi:hypothetical protein
MTLRSWILIHQGKIEYHQEAAVLQGGGSGADFAGRWQYQWWT